MAKRKKARASRTRAVRSGGSEYKVAALSGKAPKGKEWEPSQPQLQAAAMPEVREPRPYKTRYPIPNEEFERLKARAPKAKLALGKITAERVKDSGQKKAELAGGPAAMGPAEPGAGPAAAPSGSTNFAGIAATGWRPPDCTMAVGPQHVLLSVNSAMAIYNKTGGAPVLLRSLTQWFANVAQGMTIFDPKALYDQHDGRWVLMAVAIQNTPKRSLHLISVSNSSDALGPWRNYSLDAMRDGGTATNNWADYPALGVDHAALYVTSNMFAFGGNFQYAKIRVIPKPALYSGAAPQYFDFVPLKNADNSMAFTIQPCHTFGAPQVQYLVNSGFPSGNYLTLWSIANAGTTPTLSRQQVAISPYTLPPNADQQGGDPPLSTGDVRVLHAVFRGDSVWTAFTTAHNWGGSSNRASVQWCQIRAAVPAVVQEGVYGAANYHYFYPAPCPDNNGNMTMVLSRSGPSEFASILYTGRRSTDPLGTLQPSAMLKAGAAHYTGFDDGGRNRWGDYAGVAADPSNSRLVWFYSGYASAANTWGTWAGSSFF